MAKLIPYPLRLESDQEDVVQGVCRATGLSKAFVLRMAIDSGLGGVDWGKFKRPSFKTDELREVAASSTAHGSPAAVTQAKKAFVEEVKVSYRKSRRKSKTAP